MRSIDILRPRFHQRLQRWMGRLGRVLRLSDWFPHIPLAAAVGVLGIFNILPALQHTLGLSLYPTPLAHLSSAFLFSAFRGVPQGAAGVVLLAMSVGLVLRSRFAWAITLLIVTSTLVLEIHHHPTRITALAAFNGVLLALLLAYRRRFDRSSLAAGTLFTVISVMLLLGYGVFGSYVLGADFSPPIHSLPTAVYFAIETMSTVGYGDIVPKTDEARMFVVSLIILGITVFAASISAVVIPTINGRMQRLIEGEKKRMPRKNHYIIAGDTPLARNTYRELKARKLPVVVIIGHAPDGGDFDEADLIIGDSSDTEVLKKASADLAMAVLALRADDSENAFVVLAVKEMEGTARTVAAVNDSKNMGRVRRVQPDMVIAPQVMGGELLAMALNGEHLDSETLMHRIFHFGQETAATDEKSA